LQEARQRVDVAAHAAEQADESLRIAQERYSGGLGTQTQLLEAETFRVQAIRNRYDAALDAQLAELRLARSAGML
jgi:outer membrane protein